VLRTCTLSPRPPTASADARRPASHGRGSTPSPSPAVAGAQLPTPSAIQFLAVLTDPFSFRLLWFSSWLFTVFMCLLLLENLLNTNAVTPPPDVAPAAMRVMLATHAGHMSVSLYFVFLLSSGWFCFSKYS